MTLDCTCNRLTEAERKAALWDGIVMCGECSLCKKSVITDDEGNVIDVKHECTRPFMVLQREGMVKSAFSPLNGMIVVLQQVCLDGFCAWGKRREDA